RVVLQFVRAAVDVSGVIFVRYFAVAQRNAERPVREDAVAEQRPVVTGRKADADAAVERDRVAFAGIHAADDAAAALGLQQNALAKFRIGFGAGSVGAVRFAWAGRWGCCPVRVERGPGPGDDFALPPQRPADDGSVRVARLDSDVPPERVAAAG